jgi:hypothetical protein
MDIIASERFSYLTRGKALMFRRKEQVDVFRLTRDRLMRGKSKVRFYCFFCFKRDALCIWLKTWFAQASFQRDVCVTPVVTSHGFCVFLWRGEI